MEESTRLLIIGVIAVLVSIFAGTHVHRQSLMREPVHSGIITQIMNLIACMAFAAVIPTALLGLILGVLHSVVPTILGLFAVTFVALLIFAVLEWPVASKIVPVEEEELWTAEKARTSGL